MAAAADWRIGGGGLTTGAAATGATLSATRKTPSTRHPMCLSMYYEQPYGTDDPSSALDGASSGGLNLRFALRRWRGYSTTCVSVGSS